MTEYDPRYKTTFSNRWLMQQFVQAFLHDSVTDIMDFESLEMTADRINQRRPEIQKIEGPTQ